MSADRRPAEPLRPDAVLAAYMKDVDRTLLRESLKRTPQERFETLIALQKYAEEARRARALRR